VREPVYAAGMRILPLLMFLIACGGPSRTTYANYPGAPLTYDRASANKEALDIADKVVAAAGGEVAWQKAKQIKWHQEIVHDGKVAMAGDQAWDRWNARHWARLEREGAGAQGVFYDIYGSKQGGFMETKSGAKQPVNSGDVIEVVKVARGAWQRDATITFAAFLLLDPGSKIEYAGMVKDGDVEYHDLKLTFDPKDTARTGLVVHVYADKEKFTVHRVELETPDGNRYAYEMSNYQTVGGLQIATERKNLGSGETIKLSNIKVGEPDDDLFIAPLSGG